MNKPSYSHERFVAMGLKQALCKQAWLSLSLSVSFSGVDLLGFISLDEHWYTCSEFWLSNSHVAVSSPDATIQSGTVWVCHDHGSRRMSNESWWTLYFHGAFKMQIQGHSTRSLEFKAAWAPQTLGTLMMTTLPVASMGSWQDHGTLRPLEVVMPIKKSNRTFLEQKRHGK